MAHEHNVFDTDPHFVIDAVTKKITTSSPKVQLAKDEHKSERFTFEAPRNIDGHDMTLCNKVRVHYINVSNTNKEQKSADLYEVEDFQVNPNDETKVVCSWLIKRTATKYAGSLSFVVEFACMSGDKIDYSWRTLIYSGISVADGINNAEIVADENSDVLEAWLQRILDAGGADIVQTTGNDATKVMSQKASSNAFANALKGTASGEAIAITDASPIEHEMGVRVSGVSDISTVKVKRHGKNLFKATTEQKVLKGITAEKQADGTYHVYGTSDGTGDFWMDMQVVVPKGTYTGSGCPTGGSSTTYFIEYHNRTTGKGKVDYGTGATFETAETNTIVIHMVVKSGQTVDLIFKPMIEAGTGDKVYEPYIEPIEYPVSADGTVEGVTPIYPTTTLMTDTAGAVIDCTYNRDINRVLDDTRSAVTGEPGQVLSFDADGNLAPMPLESLLENSGGISNTAKDLLLIILQNAVYANDQSANITALGEALSSSDVPDVPTAEIIPLGVVIGAVSRADGQKITYDPREVQYIRASTNPIAVYVESGKTYKISLTDYSTYCINFQTFTYSTKGTDFTVVGGTLRIINGDFTRTYTSGWKNEDILYTADGTADIFIIQLAKGANHDETLTADDLVTLESMLTVTVE